MAVGPETVQDHAEKVRQIRQRLQAAQDRQKKYADPRRRAVEFAPGEYAYLRVSPMKGHRKGNYHPGIQARLRLQRELEKWRIG